MIEQQIQDIMLSPFRRHDVLISPVQAIGNHIKPNTRRVNYVVYRPQSWWDIPHAPAIKTPYPICHLPSYLPHVRLIALSVDINTRGKDMRQWVRHLDNRARAHNEQASIVDGAVDDGVLIDVTVIDLLPPAKRDLVIGGLSPHANRVFLGLDEEWHDE